jgi:prevent-host-death family protein
MLNVELHNIVSEEEAYQQIRELVDRVARTREPVVITRGGHASIAIVDVEKLENMTPTAAAPAFAAPVMPMMAPELPQMPSILPDMPTMSTTPSPMASINDSPMNEAIEAPESPMSAPIAAAPIPETTPTAEAAPAPVMPMPIMTSFGQDIPESSDPTNGSPLA